MSEPSATPPGPTGPERRRRKPGRRRAVLIAAACVCAAAATAVVVQEVSSTDASNGSSGTVRLREPTEAEKDVLHDAEQRLLRDCMGEHGFEYRTAVRQPVPEAREFPYVVDDTDWARRHGYGSDIERRLEEIRRDDPNQRYFRSLPAGRRAAALAAANGERPTGLTVKTPDGLRLTRSTQGRRAEAERRLYGDLGAWFQARSTMDALRQLRTGRVTADPAFAEAARPWARCMRAAGHDYADPAALRRALPPPEHPLPREREVALAVAEATCARESGLAVTARRLDGKYDTELRRRYRAAVNTGLRLQLAALPRARTLIGTGEGQHP
ncbi:hypothetical protein [Streptomyces aureoversilis]|uniref:Secreted protein n=1 Tax=Streptomyces aureoversilis TaxID=67277 RepID=A0ABV9ZTU6_9ACTN